MSGKIIPLSNDSISNEIPTTRSDSCNDDLKKEFSGLNCNDENYYSPDCNKFLLKKEIVERDCLNEHPDENPFLYPNLNDPNFIIKIAPKNILNFIRD
jgi:hypothetical protein